MSFVAPGTDFSCQLECSQCAAETKNGVRCKRRTRKQLPYCFAHARSILHLDIRPSTIPNTGFGLFALQEFKSGDLIVEYKGEVLTRRQLENRYGTTLAPYALKINNNTFIDSACARGTGSFINTYPRHNNARISVYSGRAGHPPSASIRATRRIPVGAEIFVDYGPLTNRFISPREE